MKPTAIVAIALGLSGGCGDVDRNPLLGGGGGVGSGSGMTADAGLDGGSEQEQLLLEGSVCELTDVRSPGLCVSRPQGVTVTVGLQSAVTDDSGNFAIDLGLGVRPDVIDFRVDDGNVIFADTEIRVRVTEDADLGSLVLPILAIDTVTSLELSLGEASSDTDNLIITYLTRGGVPLVGAQVASPPEGTLGGTYYDSPTPPYLDIGVGTGPAGVAAIFGVPSVGEVTYSIAPSIDEDPVGLQVPSVLGGVSFTAAELPAPESP